VVVPVVNPTVNVFYPDGFHDGLWGGEGVVWGLKAPKDGKHKPNYKPHLERYWWPKLHDTVVYSEILGKHIALPATERGEWLVDKHFGLDFYLLETPVNEVYATGLLQMKRCMLLALVRGQLWPNDDYKRRSGLPLTQRVVCVLRTMISFTYGFINYSFFLERCWTSTLISLCLRQKQIGTA